MTSKILRLTFMGEEAAESVGGEFISGPTFTAIATLM